MRNSIFAPLYMIGALLCGSRPSHAHPVRLTSLTQHDLDRIERARAKRARKAAKRAAQQGMV